MKAQERHKLKENEFARTVAHARDLVETRGRDIARLAVAVAVIAAIVIGYSWWRQARNAEASASLAQGLAIFEAPVVPPAAPAPGSPMPVQQAGTYQTEQAKLEAALPKLMETAEQFPNTDAGMTARYYAASALASLGRYQEAEQRFQEVADQAGSSLYGHTAKLGQADAQVAQGKFDGAIAIYKELATGAKDQLPADGVLMALGRASVRAGRTEEATRAFQRVIDEFPDSVYVADARRELEEARKGAATASATSGAGS
jgi:TolA-binding protein